MVKKLISAFLCGLFFLVSGGVGHAALVTFEETFLGNSLGDKVDFQLNEGHATFGFDLTSSGGVATLYNQAGNQVGDAVNPSIDATGFEPGRYTLSSGTLVIDFFDNDNPGEEVVIRAEALLDGTLLKSETLDLANNGTSTAAMTIDLADHLTLLEDGLFLTFVITPEFQQGANSIHIDRATLTVDAAPVPVPAALPLMLSGLGGLYLVRRKFSRSL